MRSGLIIVMAAAMAACTQGPEGRMQRVPEPDSTPATDQALAAAAGGTSAACMRNLSGQFVEFTLESDGELRHYALHDGEEIRFRDAGRALVRFTSVADIPDQHLRSRFYLLDLDHGSRGCSFVFRLDTDGGIDLFGTGVQGMPG